MNKIEPTFTDDFGDIRKLTAKAWEEQIASEKKEPTFSSYEPEVSSINALDFQVGGGHYKGMAIQPMEFSMANNLNSCQHTILKYVLRYNKKGTPLEDLTKAKHTIDLLITLENITK